MLRMKEALSGNRHAADYVLAEAARLFGERENAGAQGASSAPTDVDAHDAAILEALRAMLLGGEADTDADEAVDDGEPEEEPS